MPGPDHAASEGAPGSLFPHMDDQSQYRCLSTRHVETVKFGQGTVLKVAPEALSLIASQAFHDISHLLRPGHLKQLRRILDDPEASDNDRFVAFDLLKNANIAAGGILP